MTLGLPNINIEFKQQGISAMSRGDRGIVGLILKDTTSATHTIYDVTDIPEGLSESNKDYIELALMGNTNAPIRIEVYVLTSEEAVSGITNALDYFNATEFDYLAMPEATSENATAIGTWIKSLRDTEKIKCKAVLANTALNHEGVINFTTTDIQVGATKYTADKYCARIAGFIAGTSLRIATTYSVLPEVTEIPKKTKAELNTAIGKGEFVLMQENGKVKVARGITSLTETSEAKGDAYKKIKIVDILDLIHNDIKRIANDNYIGKYGNSYDNKCILITAIQGYLEQLEVDGLLEKGTSYCGIDIMSQKAYLKSTGVNVNIMADDEIKIANTKDKVFLEARITPLDAIEEISLVINM